MSKIHKGDKVLVIAGKDKGKTGKIVKSFPATGKVVVDGVNVRKKHSRPKKEGEKGQVVQISMPVDVSNVKFICSACGKPARIGYNLLDNGKKVRICKKCGQEL